MESAHCSTRGPSYPHDAVSSNGNRGELLGVHPASLPRLALWSRRPGEDDIFEGWLARYVAEDTPTEADPKSPSLSVPFALYIAHF